MGFPLLDYYKGKVKVLKQFAQGQCFMCSDGEKCFKRYYTLHGLNEKMMCFCYSCESIFIHHLLISLEVVAQKESKSLNSP